MTSPGAFFKRRALMLIEIVWGGDHHVDTIKWQLSNETFHPYSHCIFKIFGPLGTYDYDDLHKLDVFAHILCVRAEVRPGGRSLKILLSDRWRTSPGHPMVQAHPTLEDHLACLRGDISYLQLEERMLAQKSEISSLELEALAKKGKAAWPPRKDEAGELPAAPKTDT